jgi:hypothetical protein
MDSAEGYRIKENDLYWTIAALTGNLFLDHTIFYRAKIRKEISYLIKRITYPNP